MGFITTLISRATTTTTTNPRLLSQRRTIFDGTFQLVRDRGLDHAVEREKNLKPLIDLKNLIKLEPSKSLPASLIRDSIDLPFRPIEFIRKYPTVFEEFLAGGLQPHIKLTPEVLDLDAEEQLTFHSDIVKQQAADRLLKLLMISRIHKIPLGVIERLKWDLGLPHDYVESVVPEFPDYFRVRDDDVLELVCWSDELAVSVLEKKCMGKGKEVAFPVQFSSGFEMDKKYEKWLKEWNKLPYVSPYENAAHLPASSDESDRWVVGVLHEILHVLVPKKTERDNVFVLGELLGLRSRFKRALLQHPGIFYLSSKIGTYTVVLREGYKRGSLIEDHPVMQLRGKYVHLMNTVKEESKEGKVAQGKSSKKEGNVAGHERKVGEEEGGDEHSGEEQKGERFEDEVEDASESAFDDDSDDDEEKEEERSPRGSHGIAGKRRGRDSGKVNLNADKPLREGWGERSSGKPWQRNVERNRSGVSERTQTRGEYKDVESSAWKPRQKTAERNRSGVSERTQMQGGYKDVENSAWKPRQRTGERNRSGVSERTQMRGGYKDVEHSAWKPRQRSAERNRSGVSERTQTRGGYKDVENSAWKPKQRSGERNRSGTSERTQMQGGNKDVEHSAWKPRQRTGERNRSEVSERTPIRGGYKDVESSQQKPRSSKGPGRPSASKKTPVL
ncbi:protein WHAT'S THIS FACTOR 9, mitochondrial [Lotus japonicus]|uniref:protein WHAT'S THIS FACTOR 9, mitochondrial n=1 Tax=Lotus japonicus TaxID=34305 RepID=UPI002587A7FD|nr:protein WHAT'S THIS FACTOR 9, mitochondrial [Lotus japonicus]